MAQILVFMVEEINEADIERPRALVTILACRMTVDLTVGEDLY